MVEGYEIVIPVVSIELCRGQRSDKTVAWKGRRHVVREDTLLQTSEYHKSAIPSSPSQKGPLVSVSDVVSPSSVVDASPVGPASWD